MVFAILIWLGATFFIRIALAIFRKVPGKVRSIISLAAAIGMLVLAWHVRNNVVNNLGDDNGLFALFLVPLLLAFGIGFVFVSTNFEDDDNNWLEYFSIGSFSFGKDINIGITIQIGAGLLIATLVFLLIVAFTTYVATVLYGIIHLYFFIRVFFSRTE